MTGPIDPTGTTDGEGVVGIGTVVGGNAVVEVVGATTDVDAAGEGEWTTGVAVQAASPTALTRNAIGPRRGTPLWWSRDASEERRCPNPESARSVSARP